MLEVFHVEQQASRGVARNGGRHGTADHTLATIRQAQSRLHTVRISGFFVEQRVAYAIVSGADLNAACSAWNGLRK
jgi:hypothetical protein